MRKFVLAHESLGYHVGEGIDRLAGYELHPIATPGFGVLRLASALPTPITFAVPPPLVEVSAEPIVLHLNRFGREEWAYPRERRRNARAGARGRRGARRIPLSYRWEVGVYMTKGTPEPIAMRLAERHMGSPVRVEWRRR